MKNFFKEHKLIARILAALFFLICLWMIFTGQKTIGAIYLGRMVLGLCGLLLLLYLYNRPYRR